MSPVVIPHAVNIIYYAQIGLANPFLGLYFLRLSENFILTGLVTAIPLLFLAVVAPLWGNLADRFSAKPILFFAFLSTVFCYTFLSIITNPLVFFVLYCFFNLTMAGFYPSIQRVMSKLSDSDNQGSNFGFWLATASLGFLLGSIISGLFFDTIGFQVILLLTTTVCLIGVGITLLLSDQKAPEDSLMSELPSNPNPEQYWRILPPNTFRIYALFFIIYSVIGIGSNFGTIFIIEEYSVPSIVMGGAMGAATALGSLVSIVGATWASQKI